MDYHLVTKEEVMNEFSTTEKGLSKEEVVIRLKKYGQNKIEKKKDFKAIKIFLSQFKSFLIIVLIVAAILSYFFMNSQIDAIVIIAIVLLNAFIGFSQEYKAEKAIEELKKMMVSYATVIRDGRIIKITSNFVVPGDIMVLSTGDKIAADSRVINSYNLKVNEASLTGESFPEEKNSEKIENSVPLADRHNMLYQGTEVVYGSCKAVVVSTGIYTELGKISRLVQEVKASKNPFQEKLDSFATKVAIIIFILSIIIVSLLILTGVPFFRSFLVAISLAISAIPEGLPAVVSLGLAFATNRMLKKNVLVRKLTASETLGRTTVICTDKTGTITEEKMKVSQIYVDGKTNPETGKELLLKIGILCNNAKVENNENGEKYYLGDPTEIALIESAENNFLDKKILTSKEPKVKEFSFSSDRKIMSVIRASSKKHISYVKGAPEEIIFRSSFEIRDGKKIKLNSQDKKRLTQIYEEMARSGLRVLGFAYKSLPGYSDVTEQIAENDLIFIGFQGLRDPPRAEVKSAIKQCNDSGIKVMMITGDSKITAEAIAREIGLVGKVVDSKEMNLMSDRDLYNIINEVSVFSRISPEDKLRIINILKQKNEIVAMTGDGVNDALALKRADIGIAMGIRGTDIARDSSDLILIDDNFSSIVEGVKEGRRIYDNTKKSIKYLLSANFYEVFFIILVTIIWRNPEFLPMLPLQILWINLVTDSLPALALSAEEEENNVMKRKPNRSGLLSGMGSFIFFSGAIGLLIISIAFIININDMALARTMVVTTSIIFQMFLAFNCKSEEFILNSKWNSYLFFGVLISVLLHLVALYSPLNSVFGFVPLGLNEWGYVLGLSLIGFVLVEVLKVLTIKKR